MSIPSRVLVSTCQHSSVLVGTLHCHRRYPHEAEVLFAPLPCIELQRARTASRGIALQLVLSINLLAPTIEKVVAKLKTSHVDLLRLFISDFKAHGVPAAVHAAEAREERTDRALGAAGASRAVAKVKEHSSADPARERPGWRLGLSQAARARVLGDKVADEHAGASCALAGAVEPRAHDLQERVSEHGLGA